MLRVWIFEEQNKASTFCGNRRNGNSNYMTDRRFTSGVSVKQKGIVFLLLLIK